MNVKLAHETTAVLTYAKGAKMRRKITGFRPTPEGMVLYFAVRGTMVGDYNTPYIMTHEETAPNPNIIDVELEEVCDMED